MITVNVQNGDTADVVVTVTDKNTAPPTMVMNNQRLNYASAPVVIQITDDDAGRGNVDWAAYRFGDPTIIKSDSNKTLTNGDPLNVSAI